MLTWIGVTEMSLLLTLWSEDQEKTVSLFYFVYKSSGFPYDSLEMKKELHLVQFGLKLNPIQ